MCISAYVLMLDYMSLNNNLYMDVKFVCVPQGVFEKECECALVVILVLSFSLRCLDVELK